jgi:hypothetical protein
MPNRGQATVTHFLFMALRRSFRNLALIKRSTDQSKSANPNQELVPYIPRELATDTIEFLRSQPKVKALCELIYGIEKMEKLPEKDQSELAARKLKLLQQRKQIDSAFRAHESKAQENIFDAIRQLPPDLYHEAIQSSRRSVPRKLLFHARFEKQIFSSLNDRRLVQLQAFENLMHIRYPHAEMRKRKPDLFWIPANQIVSKQQELAMKTAAQAKANRK